ncbi:uncharacterized protein LOC129942606 [Eupeodes corollae]|uniref:uncharacterized protein LOC129942606 n=1 Tax=Eupeodes corollae TaxID=290404 RepID=UPI0024916765|nr:uncharacterized protein LOC129942606 [Eupeodes corollae]
MHFLRMYLMSLYYLVSANVLAYGLTNDNGSKTSLLPSSSAENDQHDHQRQDQDQPKATYLRPAEATRTMPRKTIKSDKSPHILNKKLLNKLGLAKVRAPNSHNRKRLAVESRRHASPDDSHMFIIKLPPNLYYYTGPKAGGTSTASNSAATSTAAKNNALDQGNGKKVSFNFNSNGKPSHIYHWNLPVIKKILSNESRFPTLRSKDDLIDIKNTPTWSKPWENETIEKSFGKSNMAEKKSMKRKSPSYYAPANSINKNSFNKYFAGNGKPKGFYVIKKNHKKATYFRNITP